MVEPRDDLLTAEPTVDNPVETTPQNWYPDEYKEIVSQKGWASSSDALKSYSELEKAMGSRVKLPTPESSAEEVSAFYAKIGRPENADGYEIKDVPENVPRNKMIESLLRKVAWDNGTPKATFEAIVNGYFGALSQNIAQIEKEGDETLQQDWGSAYEANSVIVQRTCDELIPDEKLHEQFTALIKDMGLRNNPVFAKVILGIGEKMLDDSLIKGNGTGEKKEGYRPQYPDSPEMYATGDDDESKKAREYFIAKGHNY